VRWVIAMGLIAGCGRLGFDPLADDHGGTGDSGVGDGDPTGDAAGSGDASPSRHYIGGGNALQVSPATSMSTITGPLTDTNMVVVVAIHWNNATSSVATVQDTFGNGFTMSGSVTRYNAAQSQITWFKRVTAGITINVLFDQATGSVDLKWAAYREIDQMSPTRGSLGDGGTGATADTGALSVTGPAVLVASSSSLAQSATAGPGYTERHRSGGGVLEDRDADQGAFNATAALSSSDDWIIQVTALRPR
jgi:hypothetical protein